TNVRKHAAAQRVTIRLAARDGWVEAEVADNGRGFDAEPPRLAGVPRFGLATMRERAEAVGGAFTVASTPGEGTRVVVRLPIARPQPAMRGEPRAGSDR
ncbi:MAG TPA: ATP-binding protein, partial [Thermomicrobiales bacterium]|nr:ATP-binding protein [Thermomicrobiales bacterium]